MTCMHIDYHEGEERRRWEDLGVGEVERTAPKYSIWKKKSNKKEVIKTNKYHVVQCCDAMMNLKAVKLNKPGTEDKDHTTSLIYRN